MKSLLLVVALSGVGCTALPSAPSALPSPAPTLTIPAGCTTMPNPHGYQLVCPF